MRKNNKDYSPARQRKDECRRKFLSLLKRLSFSLLVVCIQSKQTKRMRCCQSTLWSDAVRLFFSLQRTPFNASCWSSGYGWKRRSERQRKQPWWSSRHLINGLKFVINESSINLSLYPSPCVNVDSSSSTTISFDFCNRSLTSLHKSAS